MKATVWHLIDANGDTPYFRAIARHIDRRRYALAVGSLAPPGPLQAAMTDLDVATFALGAGSRRAYPLALVRLARRLRGERVSLLHAHCFYPTLVGVLAARLARTRFVYTRHHSDHNIRLGKRWHTRIDGWCARRADGVIAVSEATARIMAEAEGVPRERIQVVHNGMDPLPAPAPEAVDSLGKELGFARSDRICLMLGRLHEEKGQFVLFRALPSVLARHATTRLLVVGGGPHRPRMEASVARLGLQDVVRFLGPRRDVAALMRLSDVVVVPSLAESFGFVALEAMSMGRPVVAAATGGLPELIADGETGLLTPKGEPQALADAITRLLSDPALADALGGAARRKSEHFTAERMVRGYESVYGDVLGR